MNFIRRYVLSTQTQTVLSMALFSTTVFLFLSTNASTAPSEVVTAFHTSDLGLKLFIIFGMTLLFPSAISLLTPANEKVEPIANQEQDQLDNRSDTAKGAEIFPIAFEFAPAYGTHDSNVRKEAADLMDRLADIAAKSTSPKSTESQPFNKLEIVVASGIAELEGIPTLNENSDLMFRCIQLHGMLAFSRSSVDEAMAATSYERAFELYQMCEQLHPEATKSDAHEIMIYVLLKRYYALLSTMDYIASTTRLAPIKATIDAIRARRLSTIAQQERSEHGTPTFSFRKPQPVGSSTGA